jgi:peroxidase
MQSLRDRMEKLWQRNGRRARGGARRAKPAVSRRRLDAEALEERCLLSSFYSYDGTGNNPFFSNWGSVGQDLLRAAPAQYGDGISSLGGTSRPSARLISDVIVTDSTDGNTPNNRFMSDWIYAWGQFIDHDIDLTSDGTGTQLQAANVPVPTGDPYFDPNSTGTQVISFNRSEFDPNTGTSVRNPRQQFNDITAWLDGSMIYGSDAVRADALRAHVGGQLLTSAGNLMPFNTAGLPNANQGTTPDNQLFLAGDVRANENIELSAVQTLFVREHNRIAAMIQAAHPTMSDEDIYQAARAVVIAEVQSITFNEFLPALLGSNAVPAYQGYNPLVNPGIANEFSTAAFRLGHSLLAPDVQFLNPDGSTQDPSVSLANSFFNPNLVVQNGVDPILKYLATDNAQEVDNKIVPELQNFLFGNPGQGGFDLASLNIQRGRDHGLADYNTTRAAYGLPRVTSFAQISSNPTVQAELKQLYGNVNNIDLWVGGLAEDHVAGGSVGPLFSRIIMNQFQRIRTGDRFWYENIYSGATLSGLEHTTLEQIVARNTVNNDFQDNVFFFKMQIQGTVFNDVNGNGIRDFFETGVKGRVIQLFDSANNLIAQTTTDASGHYSFDNLTSNLSPAVAYQVREVLPPGVRQTTADPAAITFTRGRTFSHIDFGNLFSWSTGTGGGAPAASDTWACTQSPNSGPTSGNAG